MSINVFKKHPGNKITFSNRSVLCGELKVVGSRPKVISPLLNRYQMEGREGDGPAPKYFGLETPLGLCWWWCVPPSGFVSGAGRTLLIVVSSSRSAPCEYSLLVSSKQSTAQMKLFHRMRLMIIIIKIIMCAFIWHCINSPQMLVLALLLLLLVPSRSPTPYDG